MASTANFSYNERSSHRRFEVFFGIAYGAGASMVAASTSSPSPRSETAVPVASHHWHELPADRPLELMKRFLLLLLFTVNGFAADQPLSFKLQTRTPAGARQTVPEQWLPQRTAIIVC